MIKTCETCKFSRSSTGFKCTMNSNSECGGDMSVPFEYNFWTPWPDDGDIESMFCKNCGKKWVSHFEQFCYASRDPSSTFCPEGYEPSDICARCYNKLSSHYRGVYCSFDTITENTFIKMKPDEIENFFSDKDFEI